MDRILIVEDELDLAEAVRYILVGDDYEVDVAHDGEKAIELGKSGEYDALVLDLMLPKFSGEQVIKEIRAAGSDVPIIVVSAKGELDDKVDCLDMGADGYLTKPFSPRELVARLRSMLRRRKAEEQARRNAALGDMTFNEDTCALSKDGESIVLSETEVGVLKAFAAAPGVPLSREEILVQAWGEDADVQPNIVEAYVSFLRQKFAFLKSKMTITTVRNVGYRLDDAETVTKRTPAK